MDWLGVRGGAGLAAVCCPAWLVCGCGSDVPGTPADGGADGMSAADGAYGADARSDGSDAMDGGRLSLDAATDVSSDSQAPGGGAGPDGNVDAAADVFSGGTDGAGNDGDTLSPFGAYRWVSLPAPGGTLTTAIAVDSEGVLYAGAGGTAAAQANPAAGIFKSTDQGASWRPVNYGVYDYHVASLLANGTTIYAGTTNLLRSVDRGVSWQQVTPVSSVGLMSAIGAQGNLVITASTYGGAYYVSKDNGNTFTTGQVTGGAASAPSLAVLGPVMLFANDSGVVRSIDGGATFTGVQGINNGTQMGANLACDGVQTCYANAHNTTTIGGPTALLKSTDAGATWTPLGPANAPVLAVSDTGILYILSGSLIDRSDDGGATFVSVNVPTTGGAFQPNCFFGAFAARGNQLFAACIDGVYRSDDKGQHWQAASGSPAIGTITGPVLSMLVDTSATALGASGDIYVVAPYLNSYTPYALQRSTDGGWTWQVMARNFLGKCVLTGTGALVCKADSSQVGPQLVQRSADHGVTWQTATLPPDLSPGVQFDVADIASSGSAVYAGGSRGVARSDDDGLTFQLLPATPAVGTLQVLHSGHILANGFRSNDRGATWQALSMYVPLPILEDAAGRLLRPDTYVGVAVSVDEGDTWQAFPSNGLLLQGNTLAGVGADRAGHLFLIGGTPAPYGQPLSYGIPLELYATADDMNWGALPPQIALPNANVVAFATDKQGRLLAATSGGLFRFESMTDPGPSPPRSVVDGGTSAAPPARPLSLVVQNGPWSLTNPPLGFGVDGAGNAYTCDDNNIYVVDGAGAVS
ncbi:MAG: glycoside hydrolase, partial [Myxococcota bacterium]|nr:glycoside hydrolase [Myxococcota bacterium]